MAFKIVILVSRALIGRTCSYIASSDSLSDVIDSKRKMEVQMSCDPVMACSEKRKVTARVIERE